jgi:capsular exopolysaccharide synthesis family protein
VVDYALTEDKPLSPRMTVVYPVSFALGILLPFLVLFLRFSLDTKIHDRADLQKLHAEVPIAGEIPLFKGDKVFKGPADRSVLAESFRILGTNVNYQLPKNGSKGGQVVYVTSSIKGEGKTMVAFNLSLAFASHRKKVLLVGADLRNPQLEKLIGHPRRAEGLSDYLSDPASNWKDFIYDGYGKNPYHKVCFTGPVPANAPELLSGDAFETFLTQARKQFDLIVVDTAPTLLVTDTFLISQLADLTLFVIRAGFTEKRMLEFSKELQKSGKLKAMAYVLNEVGRGKSRKYNYGYSYGYGEQAAYDS